MCISAYPHLINVISTLNPRHDLISYGMIIQCLAGFIVASHINNMKKNLQMLRILIVCVGLIPIILLVANDGYLPYFGSFGSTPSMVPAMNPGDLMWVNTMIDFEDIQIGDIIVFKSGYALIAHRVINDTNGIIITKGDANDFSDPPVVKEQYVGYIQAIWKAGIMAPFLVYPLPLIWIGIIITCITVPVVMIYKNQQRDTIKDTLK